MSASLKAVQMVWRDLADQKTREYFEKFTRCEIEDVTQKILPVRLLIYGGIAKGLRKHVDDSELRERCIADLQDHAGRDPCDETAMLAYFVGGEMGKRAGEPAAKRMVKEARRFGKIFVHTMLPGFEDNAKDNDD